MSESHQYFTQTPSPVPISPGNSFPHQLPHRVLGALVQQRSPAAHIQGFAADVCSLQNSQTTTRLTSRPCLLAHSSHRRRGNPCRCRCRVLLKNLHSTQRFLSRPRPTETNLADLARTVSAEFFFISKGTRNRVLRFYGYKSWLNTYPGTF